MIRPRITLFCTAGLHVALVALNTFQIAQRRWIAGAFVSFLISLNWSWNVRRVACGNLTDRVIYALGAMVGFLVAMGMSYLMYGGEW